MTSFVDRGRMTSLVDRRGSPPWLRRGLTSLVDRRGLHPWSIGEDELLG